MIVLKHASNNPHRASSFSQTTTTTIVTSSPLPLHYSIDIMILYLMISKINREKDKDEDFFNLHLEDGEHSKRMRGKKNMIELMFKKRCDSASVRDIDTI